MGNVKQVGHLTKTPLNLLEIHGIGPVDTSESKQQNYGLNITHINSISTVIRVVPRLVDCPTHLSGTLHGLGMYTIRNEMILYWYQDMENDPTFKQY